MASQDIFDALNDASQKISSAIFSMLVLRDVAHQDGFTAADDMIAQTLVELRHIARERLERIALRARQHAEKGNKHGSTNR